MTLYQRGTNTLVDLEPHCTQPQVGDTLYDSTFVANGLQPPVVTRIDGLATYGEMIVFALAGDVETTWRESWVAERIRSGAMRISRSRVVPAAFNGPRSRTTNATCPRCGGAAYIGLLVLECERCS